MGGDQKVKAKSGWSVIPLSAPTPNRPLARRQFEHISATSLLDAVAIGVLIARAGSDGCGVGRRFHPVPAGGALGEHNGKEKS